MAVVCFAVFLVLGLAPPTAYAATAQVADENGQQVLRFQAASGEANGLSVASPTHSGMINLVETEGVPITPGPGCSAPQPGVPGRVECPVASLDAVVVSLGDEADRADVDDVSRALEVQGGEGADTLAGYGGDQGFDGGPDNDSFLASIGEDDSDDYRGGTGRDRIFYKRSAPQGISLNDEPGDGVEGENDNVHADIEEVYAGFDDDRLEAGPSAAAFYGDLGDDILVGGQGDDHLLGQDGADILDAASGADTLEGGGEDDLLIAGQGADRVNGDEGVDVADYSERTVRLRLSLDGLPNDGEVDEGDDIGADVENLVGGQHGDALIGNGEDNVIDGGPSGDFIEGGGGLDAVDYFGRTEPVRFDPDGIARDDGESGEGDTVSTDVEGVFGGLGADTLGGGVTDGFLAGGDGADRLTDPGGEDVLAGGAGDDRLDSRDAAADLDSCGAGADTVLSDALDETEECELINVPSFAGGPSSAPPNGALPLAPTDRVAPRAILRLARGQGLRRAARRGLRVLVICNEPCRASARLTAVGRTRRALRRLGVSGPALLGRGSLRSLGARKRGLSLRMTRAGRRAFRSLSRGRFQVRLSVTDRLGNRRFVRRQLGLRK